MHQVFLSTILRLSISTNIHVLHFYVLVYLVVLKGYCTNPNKFAI